MIDECEVKEKFFQNGRWYLRLKAKFYGRTIIPYAQHVWLEGNPAFNCVPKGYVIHHIDHNATNDDITNLVLMQKNHHTAYHVKLKKLKPELDMAVPIKEPKRTVFMPTCKPRVNVDRRRKNPRYFLSMTEYIDGERKRTRISHYDGRKFETREQAEVVANHIWDLVKPQPTVYVEGF